MSRLIDVDAITKETFINFVGENGGFISFGDAIDMLKAQPTAYDVDKVVEELHHCGAFEVDWEEKIAIDIVKRGGVNEESSVY